MLEKAWNTTSKAVNTGLEKSVRVPPNPLQIPFDHFLVTSEETEIVKPTEQDFRVCLLP